MCRKVFKARLQEADIPFQKTHDLTILLNEILSIEPGWTDLQRSANSLMIYAVKYRYPGDAADKFEAKDAIKHCRSIRKAVRQTFKLSTED